MQPAPPQVTARLTRIHEQFSRAACAKNLYALDGRVFGGYSAEHDPTPCPPYIQERLEALSRALGYEFRYARTIAELPNSLGLTSTRTPQLKWLGETLGMELGTDSVTVRSQMSAASKARVSCHEISHAMGFAENDRYSEPHEELLAESVAALVTAGLGITDGRFSADYLAGNSRCNPRLLAEVRPEAVKRASKILAAVA